MRQDKRRSMSRDASLHGMYDAAGLVVDGYRLELGERTIWIVDDADQSERMDE